MESENNETYDFEIALETNDEAIRFSDTKATNFFITDSIVLRYYL